MAYNIMEVPSGGAARAINGRKVRATRCMNIELSNEFKIPFELQYSDGSTTGYRRYAPNTPYQSDVRNEWRGYEYPTDGHTGPWTYTADRQIANVDWLNVSQGVYVCANGGNCTAPDICECAPGWIGFDCRTPVCNQGYYYSEQKSFVSGLETPFELKRFDQFMGNASWRQRLQWPYSNPKYQIHIEKYQSKGVVNRFLTDQGGSRYLGPSKVVSGNRQSTFQGGYRCSIRSVTDWENSNYIHEHPNYFSKYMNMKTENDSKVYVFWQDMQWPPLHGKSRVLDRYFENISYAYTNEGYRRLGEWAKTGAKWEHGVCILEFYRNCSDPKKQLDLFTRRAKVNTQDPDLSFRSRLRFNDMRVIGPGRWKVAGGECINEVIRGCFNNGTCVAPNTCKCSQGWVGSNCNTPTCKLPCKNGGNCTGVNECTCEKGWSGEDCSTPLCAQECQNRGVCVAPDVCQCRQWKNEFRDNRLGGGKPQFRKEDGDPLNTGWTGYDCSVPICVQAQFFAYNVNPNDVPNRYGLMGGHGGDGSLTCQDPTTFKPLPRCPLYDPKPGWFVTSNDARSFQTGCGYDPFDSGCCTPDPSSPDPLNPTQMICYKCQSRSFSTNNLYYCDEEPTPFKRATADKDSLKFWLDEKQNFRMCGKYHFPRRLSKVGDYGKAVYYYNKDLNLDYSSRNMMSNWTSNRFLCKITKWTQGFYVDNITYTAPFKVMEGAGSIYGLEYQRHVRINNPGLKTVYNMAKASAKGTVDDSLLVTLKKDELPGEGIFVCYNMGSCLGPDLCSCTDGYEGFDCNTPKCRHLRPNGDVAGCVNGGICASRDECHCVQSASVLYTVHEAAPRGMTGWTGSDCSIPMCIQGFFDPFCTDLPQAPAGQGCYRCSNGGNCTAPDVCTCAPGWQGYDCRTPVCEAVADPLTRFQLGTIFEDKVIGFENDPCGVVAIYGWHGWKGAKYSRGNCTFPNQCACLCKQRYSIKACHRLALQCDGAWMDYMSDVRNVLISRGPEFIFGTTDCQDGFEGNVDNLDRFYSCHLQIYVPTSSTVKYTISFIISVSIIGFVFIVAYQFIRIRLRRRYLLAKIERRRSRRSSEESLLKAGGNAFTNN